MSIKINKFNLTTGKENTKLENKDLCRIILSRDFFNKDSKMPELFILFELNELNNLDHDEALKLIDKIEIKITERIQKIYSSISERKSFQTDNLSEHLLELVLKSLNGDIKYVFEEKNSFENLVQNLNIFIGVIEPFNTKDGKKYYFHFSYANEVKNLLVYKLGDKYKLMDIIQSNGNDNEKKDQKIFKNITSGQLENNSFLIIANQNLTDHVIPDKIKQLVISLDINSALKHLKKMLLEIDSVRELTFSTIFVYLDENEDENRNFEPENSIEKLIITEKNTEKFLTPSILPDFKESFKKFFAKIKKIVHDAYLKALKLRGKAFRLKKSKENEMPIEFASDQEDRNPTPGIILPAAQISQPLKNKKNIPSEFLKSLRNGVKKFIIHPAIYFLTKLQFIFKKIKAALTFKKILILTFIISAILLYRGLKNKKTEVTEKNMDSAYEEAVRELDEKLGTLEANKIYKNYNAANITINEIKNILETKLSKEVPLHQQKYEDIKKILLPYEMEINKVIEVNNPEKLEIRTDSEFAHIALISGNIILFNLKQGKLLIYDPISKSSKNWDISRYNMDFSRDIASTKTKTDNEIMMYVKAENQIYNINFKKEKIDKVNKSMNSGTNDIKFYANSVYALDAETKQIYVHKNLTGQPWIKDDNVDLGTTLSFAIDSNIYVLRINGEILKFFKGQPEDFRLQTIEPLMKNPSKIYTDADLKYLYVLDPPNNRIVIFEKECADRDCTIVAQYTSSEFTNLEDFTIDEKNKFIYVLNNNKDVYKIEIK